MWNLKQDKLKQTKLMDTKNRLVVARGRGQEVGEKGEGGQRYKGEKNKKILCNYPVLKMK